MKIITKNAGQTIKIGEIFGKEILKEKFKKTLILALQGELGGGKTTFLKGLAKGLGVKGKILSPTFIIFRKFQIKNPKFKNFYHFDCYRIKKLNEILGLGFKMIIENPKNIVAIEWANKIKKILPKETLWINFKFKKPKEREIEIKWKKF